MKRLVIVGGGFSGVRLARKLGKRKDLNVTLINSGADFRYSPAMYRAATGYKTGVARIPLEWMLLDSQNIEIVIDQAQSIDKKNKLITTKDGLQIAYDLAAFGLGSMTTYFGIKGLDKLSFGIKTPEEIDALRKHIHESVTTATNAEINYVVVGAGPTGIELAAALGGYVRSIYKKHRISRKNSLKIWLVEAAPRILPMMSEKASKKTAKRLSKFGVKVLTNTLVHEESLGRLETSIGPIETHTVIWTAGAAVNSFYQENKQQFEFGAKGKVKVGKYLDSESSIYVMGDNADTKFSGLAYTAVKDADFVAKDIKRRLKHKKRRAHKDHRPIQIVPAGKGWAVLQYGWFVISGKPAAFMRRIADIIGYTDVMGLLKSLTIWTNSDIEVDGCTTCHSRRGK
ncbi:FAD-dependent oxidoreductase [Candidatus Saccharibacteria bacterium]|nr:FAD-dependent oxidoreductase [Candidatus Saccharibacteria bacterium]